jgi:uncharacterized membrane protein
MKSLGRLTSDQLMALDLTWSPSQDGDYLSKELLLRDYPNLKPVEAARAFF